MAVQLSDKQVSLLKEKSFGFLGTLMPDGRPQVSPVWVDYDGKNILVNSEVKRAKVRNLKRDPRVSVSIANIQNPYEYVEFRGRVVDMTTEEAFDHIDKLAQKYMGQEKYPLNQPGDQRIIIKIEPTEVAGYTG